MITQNGSKSSQLPVQDVMSRNPIVIGIDESVKGAAQLMEEADIGSLVVVDSEKDLAGVITEMDIVKKVTSKNLDPEEVAVEEVMSTPVETIEGKRSIKEAAELMANLGIRRLPVRDEKDDMIGIVTENDILEIAPTLIDITREYNRIQRSGEIEKYKEPGKREISGYCESCGVYSDGLVEENGELLCPECR